MPCPTCGRDMLALLYLPSRRAWHCPRCGTATTEEGPADGVVTAAVHVPEAAEGVAAAG